MFFKPYFTKHCLAAAIVASLLQGAVTAAPVFAEAVAKSDETIAQETVSTQKPAISKEQTTAQELLQGEATPATDNTAAQPDVTQTGTEESSQTVATPSDATPAGTADATVAGSDQPVGIDHSAESKPIVNEFLKEGEGIPGTEVPYQSETSLTREEWREVDQLDKDMRILQREREAFFKNRAKEKEEKEKAFAKAFADRQEYSIVFDPDDFTKKTMNANGETVTFRAYEHLVYAKKPYDAESQMLSVYIPEAYFNGGTINGFTAETAPVFMPNGVGGYMPGLIVEPQEESRHGGANSALYALSNGYVVVSPAIRGRSLKHRNGYETGKAPALIVDYKAAIRFVRKNRKEGRIPAGDTEKIIVSGTSAGGALAALAGATGNAAEYEPYLKEIGAAKGRDDVFAVMAYCPITNLENADMAYEWMFHTANAYYNNMQGRRKKPDGGGAVPADEVKDRPFNAPAEAKTGTAITPEQKEISSELKENFSEYLNSLNLRDSLGNRLNLAPDGDGLFREYIESLYVASAQEAIDTGETITKTPWLHIQDNRVVKMDLPSYVRTVKRLKGVPAFDAFDMSSGENNEFGTYDIASKHFTRYALEHSAFVTAPKLEEEEEAAKERAEKLRKAPTVVEKRRLQKANLLEQMEKDKLDLSQYMADWQVIRMMNPMHFIGRENVQTAPNWRIRHGALDRDTALAIPAILALKLKNNGKAVDFKVPWGYGHDGDYDLPDLFAWTDRVAKIKDRADAILLAEKEKEKEAKEAAANKDENENNKAQSFKSKLRSLNETTNEPASEMSKETTNEPANEMTNETTEANSEAPQSSI